MSALEIHHLSKTFAGQVVLHDVSMTVAEGEVHSLVGQNGSGKSTLIKVLAGYHQPDVGASATVHGEQLELGSSHDAHRLNVRFVHQDLGLVNDLSITENIMLGRRYPRRRSGAIDWKAARAVARDVITRAGSSLDVRRTIGELGIADRTRVAIARALPENDDPSIIVLDEPTAALPARDVGQLFGTIRHLTQAGNAVVLVSHHLD
ncbi:MAG TPA: ATP-binding cassette domain-containing protein, partial [Ilumatobacter sp.]